MTDLDMSMEEVTTRTSSPPTGGGAQRDVWILDDVVIKRDKYSRCCDECTTYCEAEYENYLNFKPGTFTRDGRTYHFAVPEMVKVGNYLIAERVKYRFLPATSNCPCRKADTPDWTHEGDCANEQILLDVDALAYEHYDLTDMHRANFAFDDETRTAWLVDIAC